MSNTEPINQITDWPSFFEQIRRRPAMWLGSHSLSALRSMISGITLAEEIHQIPKEKLLGGFPFDEFEAWADERFNPGRLSIRSFGMAEREGKTEEAAFELWFEWYDQFRKERGM